MDALVSSALIIRLSLHPSPASETSAFNKIRAFSSRCAGLFPFRISASRCSRSSPLTLTTYFFTEISRAAIIASLASYWRQKRKSLRRIKLICPVQPHLQKYFPSRLPQINSTTPHVSPHRGAYRDRHGRGVGFGGRGSARAHDVIAGRKFRE